MKKILFAVAILFEVSFSPRTVFAAGNTYYVSTSGSNTNPGTQTAPWRTIQKATDTMTAGDTVNIRNGIYKESVDLSGSTGTEGESGNATAGYISYIGESRDGVIIDGGGTLGYGFKSGYNTRTHKVFNYIKISNLTVGNFASDGIEFFKDKGDNVYSSTASHHIIIDNVKAHDNGGGGIMFCGGEDPNAAHDIIVRNCEVYNNHGEHHGIKLSGDARVITNGEHIYNSLVENNLVYNNTHIGIHVSSGNYNITVRNNTAYGNGRAGLYGYQIRDSVYENNTVYSNGTVGDAEGGIRIGSSKNLIIRGNKVYSNNLVFGITLQQDFGDGSNSAPVIANNIVYKNQKGGIELTQQKNAQVYHNTIASNQGEGLKFYQGTGNVVKNNILFQNTTQLTAGTGNIYDYNIYYPTISSRGIHDISIDPKFVNAAGNDYHLQSGSPACTGGENGTYIGAYPCSDAIPGDLNGDGHVDLFDYNELVTYFGNPYTIYDYNILVANFGR